MQDEILKINNPIKINPHGDNRVRCWSCGAEAAGETCVPFGRCCVTRDAGSEMASAALEELRWLHGAADCSHVSDY